MTLVQKDLQVMEQKKKTKLESCVSAATSTTVIKLASIRLRELRLQ